MDFLSHINLGEMLGDLTVTAFLILLAASIVVVGSMVMFPLIDLAFEGKHRIRQHDDLTPYDESWWQGQPWLVLRANFLRQLRNGLPHAQRRHLTLVHDQFIESRHRTPLIKRPNTGTQMDTDLTAPDKKARPNQASTPSNAA